jgi:hypothetical protein
MSDTINLKAYYDMQMKKMIEEGRDPSTMLERMSKRHRSGKPLYRRYEENGRKILERLY